MRLKLAMNTFDGGQLQSIGTYGPGIFTAALKCPNVANVYCTFFLIGIGDNKDEIDFEIHKTDQGAWLAHLAVHNAVTKANNKPAGLVEGREFSLPGNADASAAFHNYSIEYSPSLVVWKIDERTIDRFPPKVGDLTSSQMKIVFNVWWPCDLSLNAEQCKTKGGPPIGKIPRISQDAWESIDFVKFESRR